MKHLYIKATRMTSRIERIESTIDALIADGKLEVLDVKTNEPINESICFATVRKSTFIEFLRGELAEHTKKLRVIELEIKSKLGNRR